MKGNINLTVSGTPEEIAALALELQERLDRKTIDIQFGLTREDMRKAIHDMRKDIEHSRERRGDLHPSELSVKEP